MKPRVQKRIDALEAFAKARMVLPLSFVEVLKMNDEDRDAYWTGDNSILTRYGARRDDEVQTQGATTLVIDIHESARERWLATCNLSDEELEAKDSRQWEAELEAERSAAPAAQAASQSVWGYGADGLPIYDNDPRLAHLFRNRPS